MLEIILAWWWEQLEPFCDADPMQPGLVHRFILRIPWGQQRGCQPVTAIFFTTTTTSLPVGLLVAVAVALKTPLSIEAEAVARKALPVAAAEVVEVSGLGLLTLPKVETKADPTVPSDK